MRAERRGTLALLLALLVVGPLTAASLTEKTLRLGVVNGQVKDNQVVEAQRSLGDAVLFRVNAPDALPGTLRIRDARMRAGGEGAVRLTISQRLTGRTIPATVTLWLTLWVDGKRVAATGYQQGVDVVIRVPTATQQVMLRADTPLTLQVPANWRGPLNIPLEIVGEDEMLSEIRR